ncbi:MAG: hypothetical protein K2I37_00065 [Muribaculaceae bacterium]|nr:hypothetical protein [Muribaculaceae bacterium]
MGFMSHIADRYRRWRHTRGFGVHSPLAYTIVTEALYPRTGYRYYLETDARLCSPDPGESRRARAIYRLCVRLRSIIPHPFEVYIHPDAPKCYHNAMRLAGVRRAASPLQAQCCIWPSQAATAPTDGELLLSGRRLSILIRGRCMAPTFYTIP